MTNKEQKLASYPDRSQNAVIRQANLSLWPET